MKFHKLKKMIAQWLAYKYPANMYALIVITDWNNINFIINIENKYQFIYKVIFANKGKIECAQITIKDISNRGKDPKFCEIWGVHNYDGLFTALQAVICAFYSGIYMAKG